MIFLFLLSPIIGIIECHSSHAVIENYTQYIPEYKECGLSRHSLQTSDKCFEYHKNWWSALTNARDAVEGEAPWVAKIIVQFGFGWKFWKDDYAIICTGSLVTKQWILTAAHCFELVEKGVQIEKVTISMGVAGQHEIASSKQVIHPKFTSPFIGRDHDVALAQLDTPVQIIKGPDYYEINTICLPPNNLEKTKDELTILAGWGYGTTGKLKITGRIMYKKWAGLSGFLYKDRPIRTNQKECIGDSGSPSWQFYMNRAVQIGVLKGGTTKANCSSESKGPYLTHFIDWIISVIKY